MSAEAEELVCGCHADSGDWLPGDTRTCDEHGAMVVDDSDGPICVECFFW